MNLQIPFIRKHKVENRLFTPISLEIKNSSLVDEFEKKINDANIKFYHLPSLDNKYLVQIHLFKDEFNEVKSNVLMNILSIYAKKITIQLEADHF